MHPVYRVRDPRSLLFLLSRSAALCLCGSLVARRARFCAARGPLCPTVVSICSTVIIDCRIPRDGATLRALNTPEGPDRARCIRTLVPSRLVRPASLFPRCPSRDTTHLWICMHGPRRTGTHTRADSRSLLDIAFSPLRRIRYPGRGAVPRETRVWFSPRLSRVGSRGTIGIGAGGHRFGGAGSEQGPGTVDARARAASTLPVRHYRGSVIVRVN